MMQWQYLCCNVNIVFKNWFRSDIFTAFRILIISSNLIAFKNRDNILKFSKIFIYDFKICLFKNRNNILQMYSTQRRVLSRALRLVRFPLMTVEEFAVGPAQSGILEDREVVELFLYFTVNPKPSISFLDVPRCCLTGKEQVVSRFCQIESRWGYSGTSDRIRYVCN